MTVLVILLISIFVYYHLKKNSLWIKLKHLCLTGIIFFFVIGIICYPQQSFEAAKLGVNTWLNIVFPALLPFFIGAELLIELGVVNFIGVLLEPIVRPIFNVPGEGSFILAMSITSGYPIGVKLVTQLRNQGLFNKFESQRLISFCSTSGPLFMIGAVAIGMFHNVQLGYSIALSHYLGALATGFLFRFYKIKYTHSKTPKTQTGYITRAFREMFKIVKNNKKPFGILLGMSVKNSIETLLIIGGFITLFSVIINLFTLLGFIDLLSNFVIDFLFFLDIKKNIIQAVMSGIFEMTIGCKLIAEIPDISFLQQAVFSTILISWSGFSIHAQAASFISKTDLSMGIYLFSKLLHALLSGIFVILITPIIYLVFDHTPIPVFVNYSSYFEIPVWTEKFLFSSEIFISITTCIILFSILLQVLLFGLNLFKNFQKK